MKKLIVTAMMITAILASSVPVFAHHHQGAGVACGGTGACMVNGVCDGSCLRNGDCLNYEGCNSVCDGSQACLNNGVCAGHAQNTCQGRGSRGAGHHGGHCR